MKKRKQDDTLLPNQGMSREELEIAYMAAELKKAFRDKWQAVYGRPYRKIDRADSQKLWLQAAQIIIEMRGTPASYVEAQFTMGKSIVLPNRLVGPTARKRYTSYLIAKGIDYPSVVKAMLDTDDRIDPGKAEVRELIATHVSFMERVYGIKDLSSKAHLDVVLTSPWLFEPLAVCLVLGHEPDAIKLFSEGARSRITEYPYLKQALAELGYETQLTAILTE